MYVFDQGNARIVKFSASGQFAAEFGKRELVSSTFLGSSIACDSKGRIFVGDTTGKQVLVYGVNGVRLASFRIPIDFQGIAVTRAGEVLVSTSSGAGRSLILAFTADGRFRRSFGEPLIPGRGRAASEMNRSRVAIDEQGLVYVAFEHWPVVRRYTTDGLLLGEVAVPIIESALQGINPSLYSLEFIRQNPNSHVALPLITNSICRKQGGGAIVFLNGYGVSAIDGAGNVVGNVRLVFSGDRKADFYIDLVEIGSQRSLLLVDYLRSNLVVVQGPVEHLLGGGS